MEKIRIETSKSGLLILLNALLTIEDRDEKPLTPTLNSILSLREKLAGKLGRFAGKSPAKVEFKLEYNEARALEISLLFYPVDQSIEANMNLLNTIRDLLMQIQPHILSNVSVSEGLIDEIDDIPGQHGRLNLPTYTEPYPTEFRHLLPKHT
ncbi:MAG: hypothetical protein AAFR66_14990 [Bacteroidota bacterium]